MRRVWTEVDGLRLHARASDAPAAPGAPRVVLVHGLAVSSRYMAPTVRAVGARLPTWSPDLPGYGRSAKLPEALDVAGLARWLGRWMEAAEVAPAFLLGNSMGCQVAVDLAATRPALVRGLILAGPTVDRHARAALPQAWRLLKDTVREPPALVATELLDVLTMGPRRAVATARHALADRIEDKLPRVRAPVLVVRGARDPLAPRGWSQEVARLAGGDYAEVTGAHVVNWRPAAALADVAVPWILAHSTS